MNGVIRITEEMRDEKLEITLKDGYQFKDENGNVLNATKIVLEKKKKEPTYRPFKDKDECWAEMQKHQPWGVIKDDNRYVLTIEISDNTANFMTYKDMFENCTFTDGTPFGIKEE